MDTSELDLVVTTPLELVELDEEALFQVAGGQYGFIATATDIRNFGFATGTGATATATPNSVTATAGQDGFAVVAGSVGSLTYTQIS